MKKIISIVTLSLILLCGIAFGGCKAPEGSLSLSFSEECIEITTEDESKDYVITINNYAGNNAKFDFGFDTAIAKVVENSVTYLGDGKFQFQIAPLSAGTTTLRITLRGTDLSISVRVLVTSEITGISAKDNLFLVRGESLVLDSSKFNFTPADTKQNTLKFELASEEDAGGVNLNGSVISAPIDATATEVKLIAISTYNSAISTEFTVKIVNPIDLSALTISLYGQDAVNGKPNEFVFEEIIFHGESKADINLTINEKYDFQKQITVDGFALNSYKIDVFASEGIVGDIAKGAPLVNNTNAFKFVIGANGASPKGKPYVLTFRIYQADFPVNYKDVYVNVNAVNIPKEIRVNGQTEISDVELYHNSNQTVSLNFSVYPNLVGASNEEQYKYSISVLQGETKEEAQLAPMDLTESGLKQYANVEYAGKNLADYSGEDGDTLLALKNLNGTLNIKPIKDFDEYIAIKVSCLDIRDPQNASDDTEVAYKIIYIKIHKGTNKFEFIAPWQDGVIYVAMPNHGETESFSFKGFDYDEGSTLGALLVEPKTIADTVCDVEYYDEFDGEKFIPAISITPKRVGESSFIISTQNGLEKTLKIIVVRTIEKSDFGIELDISGNKQNSISSFSVNPITNSLESIVIKGKNASAYVKERILKYNDTNSNSYIFELVVDNDNFTIEDNSKITSVNFTGEDYSTVNVVLTLYRVENFQFIPDAPIVDSFAFKLECVDYIKNMNLSTNNGLNEKTYKSVTVYNNSDLPYTNKNLSRAYIYLDLEMSDVDSTIVTNKDDNWFVSTGNISDDGKVGTLGKIEFTPYDEDNKLTQKYIAVFECNITGINTISSFTITLKVTDKTGVTFESSITVVIQKYINVDFVYLTSAQTEIYLDATEKYKQITLSAYVMPANAMNQDIFVEYPNFVNVEQSGNNITISYRGAGEGTLRIFPVSSMKTNSTKNQAGEYYYHIALKITCADGESEQSALKISTLEDLKGIKENKHYFVDQIINCDGETLYLPRFNGSLRGTSAYAGYYENIPGAEDFSSSSQIGGITNFVVDHKGTNSGLFGELGAKAVVYNLLISGSFNENIEVDSISNIGLLAGFNLGRLYDVQVENKTKKSIITASGNVNVNMGFVVGFNQGEIKITNNSKNSTLMLHMPEGADIIVGNNKVTLILGGVAGQNAGIISNVYTMDSFVSVGLFGININANIRTNAHFAGAVVGNNQSADIIGLKAIGQIENTKDDSFVAGLVATADLSAIDEISNNDVRVFVRGYGTVAGLVAQVSGTMDSIKNNIVQATDSGNRTGLDASLIIKYGTTTSKGALEDNPNLNTVYALFNGAESTLSPLTYKNGNKVLTYFDRNQNIIPESDPYLPVINTTIEWYYGDKIYVHKTVDSTNLIAQQFFTRGSADDVSAEYAQFALAIFKQAKDNSEQNNVQNVVKTNDILNIAGISATEINLQVDKNSIANTINFGESLNFVGKGLIKLTISSALNYKNKVEIQILITNYYKRVDAYLDKDNIQSTNSITLINNKNGAIYLDLYAGIYNYKNTPIELVNNTDVSFINTWNNTEIADVNINGQTVFLVANDVLAPAGIISSLNLYEYITINQIKYYAQYNNSIDAFVFKDLMVDASSSKKVVNVYKRIGIENIVISKQEINAEPSDNVKFTIEYDTYSQDDYLIYSLGVVGETERYYLTHSDVAINEGFFKKGNAELFKLNWEKEESEGHVKYNFSLSMILTKSNYQLFKNKTIQLYVVSQNTQESAYININYTPETITAVLVNNYSYEENEGMITSYEKKYNKENMLNSSVYSSTGDYNIINAYVYTMLSEFDYLDVVLNSGEVGGYLALLTEEGTVNPNVVYSSSNNILTLRIYRNVLKQIEDGDVTNVNILPITILYSLPISALDGSQSTITFNFYKMKVDVDEIIFVKDIALIAKSAKKVEFTINDKEPIRKTENGIEQIYNVAKGKKYALNTTIVGFNEDEIYFESSNPNYAYVTNVGGVYYLNITNNYTTYLEHGAENYTPYNRVIISAYGQRIENNATARSRIQRTALNIYEFLTSEKLFDNNHLELRVLSNVDIRNEFANKIELEYDSNLSAVQKFLKSFKDYAKIKLISGGIETLVGNSSIESSNYILNEYEFKPLVIHAEAPYKFSVEYSYCYHKGVPTFDPEILALSGEVYTENFEFSVEVYMNSNEDVPLPIYNYQDLLGVNNDEFYRLVSDIVIPGTEFTTITKTPLMLDGNGYTITITGDSIGTNIESVNNFALFETISSGAVFKNITIKVKNSSNITINNQMATTGVNVALLASNNNGTITNCAVLCDESINVNVIGTVAVMGSSYFGTLVANNNGYITHSRILANVSVNGATSAGLVANNKGHISSSYVKNSRIANTTGNSNPNIVTGGFVANNDGVITTSYVEGKDYQNKIYCNYQENNFGIESKIIYTSTEVGGFAYSNNGEIFDCYSNIPVVSTAICAGFVYVNNGEISRVYSLSKMSANDMLNYAFVKTYSGDAIFEDCFFAIEKNIINMGTSPTNFIENNGEYSTKIPGIKPLGVRDFNITLDNKNFKNFLYLEENNIKGVWFYAKDSVKESGVAVNNSYETEVSGLATYDAQTKKIVAQSFRAKRLQLVAPNQISTSRFDLSIKDVSGVTEYSYSTNDPNVEYGSVNNPYLISSASDFETYFNQKTSKKLEYYRIIKDIDYDIDKIYNSKLFGKTVIANIEGNNLQIKNYTINSSVAYSSSGLFGTIGSSSAQESVIKNLTFKPKYVNLPNCTYVGGVAGTILKTKAFNINVENPNVVIIGKNIVGGVFGRTGSEAKIYEIYANITAKATYYNNNIKYNRNNDMDKMKQLTHYDESGLNRTNVAYSGAVIGYVSGVSIIDSANVGDKAHSYAMVAGLMFGGIGANATVSNINLNVGFNNQIKALAFGGIIAGEIVGTVRDVQINSDVLTKNLFSLEPLITLSIGGIAGVMHGGTIKDITSTKGYSVVGTKFTGNYMPTLIDGATVPVVDNPYVVKYAGGIVGYIYNANEISNINICNSEGNNNGLLISGGNYVGSVAGYVQSIAKSAIIKDIKIQLTGHKKYINEDGNEIDEMLYASYVSEASYAQIDYMNFDIYCQHLGLAVGYSKIAISGLAATAISVLDNIYTYYADYSITSNQLNANPGLNINNVYIIYVYIENAENDASIKIATTNSLYNQIKRQVYNLKTGLAVEKNN